LTDPDADRDDQDQAVVQSNLIDEFLFCL